MLIDTDESLIQHQNFAILVTHDRNDYSYNDRFYSRRIADVIGKYELVIEVFLI